MIQKHFLFNNFHLLCIRLRGSLKKHSNFMIIIVLHLGIPDVPPPELQVTHS